MGLAFISHTLTRSSKVVLHFLSVWFTDRCRVLRRHDTVSVYDILVQRRRSKGIPIGPHSDSPRVCQVASSCEGKFTPSCPGVPNGPNSHRVCHLARECEGKFTPLRPGGSSGPTINSLRVSQMARGGENASKGRHQVPHCLHVSRCGKAVQGHDVVATSPSSKAIWESPTFVQVRGDGAVKTHD